MAAGAGACDAGKRVEQRTKGPLITITDINVGPDKPLPIDGEIQIAFDRYLLPASVTRQSVPLLLTGADGTPVEAPLVRYDPVARVISIARPKDDWLVPGQPYKLRLTLPPNDDVDDRGLRAIDRSTLDPNQPLEFAFFAAARTGETNEKLVDFCGDVLPIFSLRCSGSTCHGGGPPTDIEAAAGLVLNSFTGIEKTARSRVANGSNTGALSGDPRATRQFGVDMPIIDPGQPDNSWLIYKIELAREPAVVIDAGPGIEACNVSPSSEQIVLPTPDPVRYQVRVRQADDVERAILNDFVPGREMPFPESPGLTFDERQRLRLWIAQGAQTKQCGGCGTVIPDAGARSDAGNEAGGGDAGDAATD